MSTGEQWVDSKEYQEWLADPESEAPYVSPNGNVRVSKVRRLNGLTTVDVRVYNRLTLRGGGGAVRRRP